MRPQILALWTAVCLLFVEASAQTPVQSPSKDPSAKSGFGMSNTSAKLWTGDFDGMIKRRRIRFLVPYSKTYYFDRAIQRGFSYEIARIFEKDLNGKRTAGHLGLDVVCVPVSRDEMIPALLEGRGDVAMGNLTITPERLKRVAFTNPLMRNVTEILITGPSRSGCDR